MLEKLPPSISQPLKFVGIINNPNQARDIAIDYLEKNLLEIITTTKDVANELKEITTKNQVYAERLGHKISGETFKESL